MSTAVVCLLVSMLRLKHSWCVCVSVCVLYTMLMKPGLGLACQICEPTASFDSTNWIMQI